MSEWVKKKLSNYIKIKHGFAFPGTGITSEESENILVTPGNFNYGGGFKSDKFKFFNGIVPEEYIFKGGEIIVTMTDLSQETDTLGLSAKVPINENKNYLHNQRVGLVTFLNNEIHPDYCYWLMRTREYQESIVNSASGTSIMHTSPDRIASFEESFPPLPEQQAIAEVLSSLDDKIDLLHRNNKTLEEMAETLFRQWFVEGAKEDWETIRLGDFITMVIDNRGKTPPTVEYKTPYPLIEVNAINSINCLVDYGVIRKYLENDVFNTWFRKHLRKNDLIVSTVGTIGVFSLFLNEKGAIAQNLIGLRCAHPFFLYTWLKNNKELLLSLDIGGVQPSIKVPHLLDLELILPEKDKLDKFEKLVEPLFGKLLQNQKQMYSLKFSRDTLLPKLMSGQVRVKA